LGFLDIGFRYGTAVSKLATTGIRQLVRAVVLLLRQTFRQNVLQSSQNDGGVDRVFLLHVVRDGIQDFHQPDELLASRGELQHEHQAEHEVDLCQQDEGRNNRVDRVVVVAAASAVAVAGAVVGVVVGGVAEHHGQMIRRD